MSRDSIWNNSYFERWPEKDFKDDRNSFIMFRYKGKLPISYLEKGKIYCCVRLDYLPDIEFKEWRDDFKICDEFNGVSYAKFNVDKLERNCEYLLKRYILKEEDAVRPSI